MGKNIGMAVCAIIIATGVLFAEQRTSITQYGITWTFDTSYETGRFVNGDWYVVGPVTVTSVSPTPTATRNGSVVNPVGGKQGYDERGGEWVPSEQASFPLAMQAGQSLVSTISNPDDKDCTASWGSGWSNYAGSCRRGVMKTQAVLTCLAAAPSEPSFRPGYAGTAFKDIFPVSAVRYGLLPELASPPLKPDGPTTVREFQRPWIDHYNGWATQYTHPIDNFKGYGRDMSNTVGSAALYTLLDEPLRDSVVIGLIQLGIDNYSVTQAGGYWPNDGGHASGRKYVILFAGLMLDNAELLAIGEKSGAYLYSDGYGPGNHPPGYVAFGEDDQTFYVTAHPDPDGAWAAGTDEDYDIYIPDGSGNYRTHTLHGYSWQGHGSPSKEKDYLEYTDEHEGMPEWGIRHSTEPNKDGLDWANANYRRGTNGSCYMGYVLAAHVLGLKTAWNHDALFDYTDRYVSIEGPGANFVAFMWQWYRYKYGCAWARTDDTDEYSNGGADCSRCEFNCPGNTLAVDDVRISVNDAGISVWPNPSNGTVEFHGATGGTVEIRDASGVVVHSASVGTGRDPSRNTRQEWNGTGINGRIVPPGLYFYTVTTPQGMYHGRIMRTR